MIAPQLYRSVDLQQEWGRVMQRAPRIPQAGIAVLGQAAGNDALVERFQKAYATSLAWCEYHVEASPPLVAKPVDLQTPEAVADSIRVDNTQFVSAADARPELEFFFGQLMALQSGLVGGQLPPAAFYRAAPGAPTVPVTPVTKATKP